MSSITKKSIDAVTALRALNAAADKAASLNLKMCIAITDEAGHLKASLRMDGAQLTAMQVAENKAYSAATTNMATHLWYDAIKSDPPLLHGIPHIPRLIIFGGGYPIKEDREVIGAIGVSGGHYSQDMECACAALDAIAASPN
jgi:uncharacterized protein GlcG (DUF336 family)